jgi:hypothetical protein
VTNRWSGPCRCQGTDMRHRSPLGACAGTAITALSWVPRRDHAHRYHCICSNRPRYGRGGLHLLDQQPEPTRGRGPKLKSHEEKKDLTGKDKSQDDLVDGGEQQMPEGLKRERKGPLDKNVGRNDKPEG